ncbi:hypothetical protein RNJ44_04907 [Nakaseomyces bracarensis]|uniref:VPS4-associated protein 1 n=1 Tax=Nakaseomyces bracarensis TaxID=273131 RepID=A0ABR4NW82_9SACH
MINEYVKRKVALRDTQGCVLCHKPSTTVLFNKSGPDWFYTCDLHLQDNPQFAVPVYGTEYDEVVAKMKDTKRALSMVQTKGGLGNWDGWVNKFISTTNKKKEEDKKDSKEDSKEEKEKTKEENTPANLQREYEQLLDRLTQLQKDTKRYKLSDVMFQNRVDLKERQRIKEIRIKKIQEQYSNTDPTELETKFNFPSVPTTPKE